jgi:hypothetical protein
MAFQGGRILGLGGGGKAREKKGGGGGIALRFADVLCGWDCNKKDMKSK